MKLTEGNTLATDEPLFYVAQSINPVSDGFEIVCILSDEKECNRYEEEELKKPWRHGVWSVQRLPMSVIKSMILDDAIRYPELVAAIKKPKTKKASDIEFRTVAACDQLTRYGGGVYSHEFACLLEKLTDINDNLQNGRHSVLIRAGIEEAKSLLDYIAKVECESQKN